VDGAAHRCCASVYAAAGWSKAVGRGKQEAFCNCNRQQQKWKWMGRIRALMPAAPMSRLMSRVVPMASAGSSERLQSGGRCREFKSALAIAGHKLTRA
jgi:hypothetical protein